MLETMHCTYFKGNYETRVICDMWKHALIARIHQQACARCEKNATIRYLVLTVESGCGQCTECFGRARLWKTRQDKTRQDKTRQDKTDETRHTTSTAEIPASDAANAAEGQDYGRDPRRGCSSDCFGSARLTMEDKTGQDKTRQDGRNTAHYIIFSATAENTTSDAGMLRKCKTVEDKTRQDKTQDKTRHKTRHKTRQDTIQDKTRQDKTDKTQHTTYPATDKTRRTEHDSIYRTMIPASDASNVSDVRDYGKQDRTRQDGRNTTHDI